MDIEEVGRGVGRGDLSHDVPLLVQQLHETRFARHPRQGERQRGVVFQFIDVEAKLLRFGHPPVDICEGGRVDLQAVFCPRLPFAHQFVAAWRAWFLAQ